MENPAYLKIFIFNQSIAIRGLPENLFLLRMNKVV